MNIGAEGIMLNVCKINIQDEKESTAEAVASDETCFT